MKLYLDATMDGFTLFLSLTITLISFHGLAGSEMTDLMDQYNTVKDLYKRTKRLESIVKYGVPDPIVKWNQRQVMGKRTTISVEEPSRNFTGKAKGFTNRQYAGIIRQDENSVSGLCASRMHPGLLYFINHGPLEEVNVGDNHIYVVDTKQGASTITTITLVDTENVDWNDLACAPCSSHGTKHCIYIGDFGGRTYGPMNLIYKIHEPDVINIGKEIKVGEDEIEEISYQSYINNIEAMMVSPSARIFIVDFMGKGQQKIFEIAEGKATYLFSISMSSTQPGPVSADISPDGTGFLFKMWDKVYYWYVEREEDMEAVLTDVDHRMELPYFTEPFSLCIAWRSDGGAYYTTSAGENEPLYRYDRLD